MKITGPAIVEEPATTIVIFPGQQATVDEYGNLRIHAH
jgi:N-methylhydantoinase A